MPTLEVAVPFRGNWYFDTVCSGIAERAVAAGVDAHVFTEIPGAEGRAGVADRFDAALQDPECVGAIGVGFEFTSTQVQRLLAHGRPVVVIGGDCEGLPSVFPDDAAVGRAATEHLLALGHTAIAHVAGFAISPDDFSMRSDRVRGYSDAMRDAGLDQNSQVVPCAFTYDAAHRAAMDLLSDDDRPTAVFAVADELALAVLDAARELGLAVPRDLSVIGIDDHPDSAAHGLTTWHQDPAAVGQAAADRVLGGTDADRQTVELTFVHRTSTGRPGEGAVFATERPRGRLSRFLTRRG